MSARGLPAGLSFQDGNPEQEARALFGEERDVFGRGIRLFKLFGFSVRVDWSWLIIAALVIWTLARGLFPMYYHGLISPGIYVWMGVAGALGLFASIVLHEFGHSLVARRMGIPMRGITLFIFGGVAEMGAEAPNPRSEFLMAIAGPLVTVILSGLFFGFSIWGQEANWPLPVTGVLSYLGWINLLLLGFNLVPAFPLDGGRVLRSILWAIKKNLRWATRIASFIGTAFAFGLMGWGILDFFYGNFIAGVWLFLIGLFIRSASKSSYEQVLIQQALAGEPVRRFVSAHPVTISASASVKSVVEDFLYKYPYKFYPVVDEGGLKGCITIDQVKQVPKAEWEQRTVGSLAVPCSQADVIDPETDAANALSRMSRSHVKRLMVVDHGQLLGIIGLEDLLNFLSRKIELERA